MTELQLTKHAEKRASQRGFRKDDFDLIAIIGSEVDDGFLLTRYDFKSFEHKCRRLIQRVRRLQDKRVVVAGDEIITAYHAAPAKQRKLLRVSREKGVRYDSN